MSDSDAQTPTAEDVPDDVRDDVRAETTRDADWDEPALALPQRSADRLLLGALAGSLILHLLPLLPLLAAFALGMAGADGEHNLGDEKGRLDGVNVELIDAKEYDRRYLSHTAGAGTGNQDTPAAAPPPKAAPPPEPAKTSPETPSPTPEEAAVPKPEDDALEPAKPQEIAKLEDKPQPKPEPRPLQPRKPDDVLTPAEAEQLIRSAQSEFQTIAEATSKASVAAYGSASPAVRAILRKLKRAMPTSPGVRGNLVVRIVLSEHGGVAALGLVRSSGKPDLDNRVLASVRNTLVADPSTHLAPKERLLQITYDYF